jgi:hypothetical protein
VTFKNGDRNLLGGMESLKSVQAISIHPLSKNKVLVLDSSGSLHVFSLPNTEMGSCSGNKQHPENIHIYHLNYPMKVQLCAVIPNDSTSEFSFLDFLFVCISIYFINKYVLSVCAEGQNFWVSDGGHSVHIMSAFDVDSTDCNHGDDAGDRDLTTIKISGHVIHVILHL